MTEMELVKRMGGADGRGDERERLIKRRTPATRGSNDDSATLKSTRHAADDKVSAKVRQDKGIKRIITIVYDACNRVTNLWVVDFENN